MFQKRYDTNKIWYRRIDDATYEILKITHEHRSHGQIKVRVYSRMVDLTGWEAGVVINHWNSQGKSFSSAHPHYSNDISRYKGDMASHIAESLRFTGEPVEFDSYDDFARFMHGNNAENFSIVNFVTQD